MICRISRCASQVDRIWVIFAWPKPSTSRRRSGSTEPVREPLGQDRADALDQAACQVPLDPVDGCGGEDRVGFDLELPAELLVVHPLAGEVQILARVHGEQVAHDGRQLDLPLPPDAGDREAVVLV